MTILEIILIGVALSMDAVAVGLTNGMAEPKMRAAKMATVAGAYALFQFLMPVLGYYCGYVCASLVQKIAPWLSFGILGVIGGKMIADFIIDLRKKRKSAREERAEKLSEPGEESRAAGKPESEESRAEVPESDEESLSAGKPEPGEENRAAGKLGAGKLLMQALATSIDALAVGVTLLAAETTEGLPFMIVFCAMLIGAVTFLLSLCAVFAGKRIGNHFADKAELLGGAILLVIGCKILIEGLL